MYETEYIIIPLKHLNTIANYYNVSLDYLFGFIKDNNYLDNNKIIDKKSAGFRLKQFRKDVGITQAKMASILKVDNTTISDFERGKTLIATTFLYTICKKYKISADYLLGKTNSIKYLDKAKITN